jgi:hypothetical protein
MLLRLLITNCAKIKIKSLAESAAAKQTGPLQLRRLEHAPLMDITRRTNTYVYFPVALSMRDSSTYIWYYLHLGD